jgi:hypothetical protein
MIKIPIESPVVMKIEFTTSCVYLLYEEKVTINVDIIEIPTLFFRNIIL